MPTFNVSKFLEEQGMALSGVTEDGKYRVTDPDGNEKTLNVDKLLSQLKLDTKEIKVKFNDPDTPLETSPVSIPDRMRMALGNTKGQIGYLKTKFEDAVVHPDNGLLVKNKGVWQKADTSSMDPWELAADVAEGAVGIVPSMVGSAIGAAKGAAAGAAAGAAVAGVGAAPGAVAGGIVGAGAGGGAGEAVRSSLGRIVGTYDATPDEQLKDIGFEALLNSGGQAVALGVKPTIGMLAKAAKTINKHAAPATKEILASVYGSTTGAGQTATHVLLSDPDGVAKEVASSLSRSGRDAYKAVETLKEDQVKLARSLITKARPALGREFEKLEAELIKQVPDNFQANIGDIINQAFTEMRQAGIGDFVTKKKVVGLTEARTDLVDYTFRVFEPDEVEKLIQAGKLPKGTDEQTLEGLKKLVNAMNMWVRTPDRTGKEAARAALTVKRSLTEAYFNVADDVADPVRARLTEFSSKTADRLAALFHEQGVKEPFERMNAFYTEYNDIVSELGRVANGKYDVETFVNKLVSNPGSNATAKGYKDVLEDLLGDEGKRGLQSFMQKEGAKGFVRFFPNPSKIAPFLGGVAGVAAVGTGAVSVPAAATVGVVAGSPRLVMKQVQYANKTLDFLKSLPESSRVQWLRNPTLVRATFAESMGAMTEEDAMTEQLLQQAGVK